MKVIIKEAEAGIGRKEKKKKKKKRLTSHRKPSKSPLGLQSLGLSNSGLWREHDRVQNETILISLHLLHHLRLIFRRAVMVDYTQATKQSHVNGHVVLSHSVHRRRHQGGLQGDALGNRAVQGDIRSREPFFLELVNPLIFETRRG